MTSPENTALFDLSDVGYAIGGKTVISGVTFRGNEQRVGVVGRNGSGKSTLARLLAGLIPATSGHLKIAGIDVAKDRKAALHTVGILFQNPDHQIIFPTVGEEIAFGLRQMGQSKAQAKSATHEILTTFNRSHWADAPIHQLSQGQRHLVCLMAVLVMRPSVIILDEPFAGLDIPTMLHLQRHLNNVSAALIHITHDPTTLAGFDRVLWLEDGQIRQDGSATAVLGPFTTKMHEIGEQDDFADLSR